MNNSASASRRTWNRVMNALVWVSAVLVIVLVAGILGMVLVRGIPHISWKFLTTTASVLKGTDGILPAILNTLYVILLTLLIVLPLGVGAAVYLTEYARNRKVISVIEFTNETLAGIPSIIYGLVGMLVFAQTLGFQTCLLSGSLTLVIMNLPTIIRTTQESLKTVPQGYREGALGLGAGKWHIIRTIVLPCSIDGIVTGCILAVGRIVGESAALLFTAGAAEVIANGVLKAYTSNGATLSVLLYLRAFEDGDFASAWGIGAVLLVLVLGANASRQARQWERKVVRYERAHSGTGWSKKPSAESKDSKRVNKAEPVAAVTAPAEKPAEQIEDACHRGHGTAADSPTRYAMPRLSRPRPRRCVSPPPHIRPRKSTPNSLRSLILHSPPPISLPPSRLLWSMNPPTVSPLPKPANLPPHLMPPFAQTSRLSRTSPCPSS